MPDRLESLTQQLQQQLARLQPEAGRDGGLERVPPALARAVVGARLVSKQAELTGYLEFALWLDTLRIWLERGEEGCPEDNGETLKLISELATYLESLVRRVDQGGELSSLVKPERLAEFQEQLFALLPAVASETARSSAIPTSSAREARPAIAETDPRVLVLLAPSLRSGDLLQRLGEAGFGADLCSELDQVMRRLGREESYRAILCDNLRPTCHLQRLFHRLERNSDISPPPVVLASCGASLSMTIQAHEWGAVGAWTPPFLTSALRDLITGDGD